MAIEELIAEWAGTACRHIPAHSPFSVLDTRFAAQSRINRWNRFGEPTLYLASDHAVLVGEFARHMREARDPPLAQTVQARRIYDLRLRLDAVLDLRDPATHQALSLHGAPRCFLDRTVARATAGFLRATTPAQALLAPSMAFLDQPHGWVMVLFLENLPAGLEVAVEAVDEDGLLRLEL
ncbi:MAG: RES domain-containing protein [Thermomicrobiales bacterium]